MKKSGKWLRELRTLNGLTQAQAAELFNTNRSTYSCWESKYKTKILPEHVRESEAIKLLIIQHPIISSSYRHIQEETQEEKKQKIFERFKQWIKKLKNLYK